MTDEGDDLLDSDDEKELEGLSGQERAAMKKRLIEKRKQIKNNENNQLKEEIKRNFDWIQKNKDNILKNLVIDSENSDLKRKFLDYFFLFLKN